MVQKKDAKPAKDKAKPSSEKAKPQESQKGFYHFIKQDGSLLLKRSVKKFSVISSLRSTKNALQLSWKTRPKKR